MKDKLLLVGAGGLGRVTLEHASKLYNCAFIDDCVKVDTIICGCKVIGTINDLDKYINEYKYLIVTIGNNELREKIYLKAKEIGYVFPNIILDSVYIISPYANIGCGCIFLNNVCIQNGSSVGNGVILCPGVEIHHDSYVGNNVLIYTNSVIRTYAYVEDRVKIGSNSTISNETKVLLDCVIDGGKVV